MNMKVIMRFTGALITTVVVVQTGILEAETKMHCIFVV